MFRFFRNRELRCFSETLIATCTASIQTQFETPAFNGRVFRLIKTIPQDFRHPVDHSVMKKQISAAGGDIWRTRLLDGESKTSDSTKSKQKIAIREMIESCRELTTQSIIDLELMETICDRALSKIDFGAITTIHLVQIVELLGMIYLKSGGIPKRSFTTDEESKSEDQRTESIDDLTSGDFIRKELGEYEADELQPPNPESEELVVEKLDDLQMGKPIRFRNDQWYTKRGIDITQPKESWYPKLPRWRTEYLEKLLEPPTESSEPTAELESNSSLEGYQTAVFVNRTTGAKRTRVVFENDVNSIFYDRDLDPEAQRRDDEEQMENPWDDITSRGDINAQIQVVRVLGSEVKKRSRLGRMSPKDLFKLAFGFCNMKYKRNVLMKSLMSYLRIPEIHSRLSNKELSDLINGLGALEYDNERILGRICAEVMEPQRLKKYQNGELVKLILGMANLKYYDQQVITTLAFQLRQNLDTVSKENVASCLLGLAKSGIRELGLMLDLIDYFLSDTEELAEIYPRGILYFLKAVTLLDITAEFEVVRSLEMKLSKLWSEEYLKKFSSSELCELCESVGTLGYLSSNLISIILNQLLHNNNYQELNNEAIVNVFHGLRNASSDLSPEEVYPLFQEAVHEKRLKNYGLKQISDLILSFSLVKYEAKDCVSILWNEICHKVRCQRYSADQLTNIFEATSRLPTPTEEVTLFNVQETTSACQQLSDLITHALSIEQLAQTRMPHFVSMLDSLSRIQYKDKYESHEVPH
eukprot:g4754.t1